MKQIGKLDNGNVIVEMTPAEWLALLCTAERLRDLPTICRDYRRENAIAQTSLAKRAGISRSYLWLIERGKANVSLRVYGR